MGTQQKKEFMASGKTMDPSELSAEVLKDLKLTAKSNLPNEEDINAAVITVPCNFEIVQCEATQKAARLAGSSMRLYCRSLSRRQSLMVFLKKCHEDIGLFLTWAGYI